MTHRIKTSLLLSRRGVGAYLGSPLTYFSVAAFYFLVGWLFRTFIVATRTSDLAPFFDQVEFMLVLVVPVFTMRTVADELRTSSIDLLYIRGIRPVEIVTAKFVSSTAFVLAVLALPLGAATTAMATLSKLDFGTVTAQLAGVALTAALLVALGTATSALSANPLAAAVIASMVGLFAWFLDVADLSALWIQRVLALRLHLTSFAVGEVRLADVVFFISLSAFFLVTAVAALRVHRV